MFSTTGLFKNIACPEGERCAVTSCMFSHDPQSRAIETAATDLTSDHPISGNAAKRRKLDSSLNQPSSLRATISPATANSATKIGPYKGPSTSSLPQSAGNQSVHHTQIKPPASLQRPVSPPTLHNGAKVAVTTASKLIPAKPAIKETLNPRKIPNDPAGHSKRTLILKYLHGEMYRLNEEVKKGTHPDKALLVLSENELIKAALDEEEETARGNFKVYANVIKNRIAAYKKMKTEDWINHVLSTFKKPKQADSGPEKQEPLVTGLKLDQEHIFLDHMISDQSNLAKHGYVPTPPTEAEMVEAKAAVAASLNFEVCDRCKSRFRVFPDRREEDGALTTNGPCVYHWARPVYPKRERTDAIKGARDATYGCCGELMGTKGCTQCDTHVFKINDPKRLASVLPFITTPDNPNPAKAPNGKVPAALTFDCEMGYTVCGFELMRLTAVTWPEGDTCIDVLVRPQGAILDFNTRFSGIIPEVYNSAIPYGAAKAFDDLLPPPPPGSKAPPQYGKAGPMAIVESPIAARELLCSYITPLTPLIGHALENDLNVVRLCHPRIIDTVMLFPHPKGLPIRYGLKVLTKQRLDRDIQMGGASGHDSAEDARATGELVRFAVKKRWEELKREGFTIENGALMPPLPRDLPPPPPHIEGSRVLGGGAGVKRQRI